MALKEHIFAVENMHCASCVRRIEDGLLAQDGVLTASVNLTNHRAKIQFDPEKQNEIALSKLITKLGFPAKPLQPESDLQKQAANKERSLIIAMAVAAFGFMNVMLFSVSIWSGDATGIDPVTRDLLQWISAIIAIPCIGYAGLPFFIPALNALRVGRVNMDVPISIALCLIIGLGLMEAKRGGDTYFDSALALEFFLLLSRVLEANLRKKIWVYAGNLLAFLDQPVRKLIYNSTHAPSLNQLPDYQEVTAKTLELGDYVYLQDGDMIGADGVIIEGKGQLDTSSLTGESLPAAINPDQQVKAGFVMLNGEAIMKVLLTGKATELGKLEKLVESAVDHRSFYISMADKVASFYTPVVHGVALAALLFGLWRGEMWQDALLYAVSVLIITCPCALALAIPAVQAAAVSKLFSQKILVKTGGALEKLALVKTALIDKTGTLSDPFIAPMEQEIIAPMEQEKKIIYEQAASFARYGRHPLCYALVNAFNHAETLSFGSIKDVSGQGLSGFYKDKEWRLGTAEFCGADISGLPDNPNPCMWFTHPDQPPVPIYFNQNPASGAKAALAGLTQMGIDFKLISGDNPLAVKMLANMLNITEFEGELSPTAKAIYAQQVKETTPSGGILGIGDGSNDAGMLAFADVSIALSHGSPLAQSIADIVVPSEKLHLIPSIIRHASKARAIAIQNLGFSALYNMIAIPIAFMGYVTPLVAAIAMSGSSIIVVCNALRIRYHKLD
ncbi:MAG: heavy metal translocating P-type ATPase [Alphaproteobacteria bacterium]